MIKIYIKTPEGDDVIFLQKGGYLIIEELSEDEEEIPEVDIDLE